MNITHAKRTLTTRFFALATIISLLLSAFPASFFVANAQVVGCSSALNVPGPTDISVSPSGEFFNTIQDALNDCETIDGSTIVLNDNVTITEQITITRPITIDGNYWTIFPEFSRTGNDNNSAIGILETTDVTLQYLKIDGVGGTNLHGVNVYRSTGVLLDTIDIKDPKRTGVVVNGSTVTVDNLSTRGSTWHAINVAPGTGVTEPSVLTILGDSAHEEAAPIPHIYTDDISKNVTINDTNSQYEIVFEGPNPQNQLVNARSLRLKADRFEIEGCKYDSTEEPIPNWGMTFTNGTAVLERVTGQDGCVSVEVTPGESPWEVIEEVRIGWMQSSVNANYGRVLGERSSQSCEFFGIKDISEETSRNSVVIVDGIPDFRCDFYNEEIESQQCVNLLANGSFEQEVVTEASLWQKFASVAGWVITKVTGGDTTTLELHRNWESNEAAQGAQYAELDGDHSTKVAQTVATLAGGEYELKWAFAARHNIAAEQNQLSVEVDGIEVATNGPTTDSVNLTPSDWLYDSYTFTATDASTDIAFADAGPSNTFGTLLDDAQLCLVKEPELEVCEDASLIGALNVVSSDQKDKRDGSDITDVNRTDATKALGINDWVSGTGVNFFSLGFAGSVTLEFDRYVLDVPGTDLKIYEGTNGTYPEEIAKIEVSQNGVDFEDAGTASSNNPSRITDIDFASTSFAWIKFVRVTDMSNLAIHSNDADGFDLDAVVATNVTCKEPVEPEVPKVLPQCSQFFTDGIVITQEQVLLSHDEGGAFIGPQTVNIPAGYYDVNALSFDFHTDNLWDNLPFEQWYVNGLLNEATVFTSESTDDLPQGQNTIVTQLDRAAYFPNGLDALEWVHSAYPNGEYHSIHPLCLQFIPVEPPIAQCTIVSSPKTVVVEVNDYAVPTYTHNNWIASSTIPGAEWIWETYYSEDSGDLDENITRTFIETFNVATPTAATLDIAADNGYIVYINDELVLDRSIPTYENNFQIHTYKSNVDVSSFIESGENELKVIVTNKGVNNSNSRNNPAGVLFKLTMDVIEGSQCEITTAPTKPNEPSKDFVIIDGYKYVGAGESYLAFEGWTIYAYNIETEQELSTTTDEFGYYYFEVGDGEWEIYEAMPVDWEQTLVEENNEPLNSEEFEGDLFCLFIVDEFEPEDDAVSDANCDFYNTFVGEGEPDVPDVITPPSTTSPNDETQRRGRSSGGTRVDNPATPQALVAGASTSVCPFLNDYMQIGIENNPFEVTKLQLFLNIFVAPTLITGIFDALTDSNVKAFQETHRAEILEPWFEKGIVPHNKPTGYVYKLTRWKINDIICPGYEAYPSFDGENLNENIDLD